MARRRVAKPAEPPTSSRATARALLVLLALLAFANGLPNGFTYDDLNVVRDNARLASPAEAGRLLTTGYWGETSDVYRPVTLLSFAVQRWVHGPSAPFLRAVNVLLHAVVVLLLFEWLVALGLERASAVAAAALFAVMPIHAEAVTSIVGRAELLAAAFSLVSALAWRRATHGSVARGRWGALSAGAFALALFSKESAAALPAVVVLAELMLPASPEASLRERMRRVAVAVGGGAAVLAAVLAIRFAVLGGVLRSPSALPSELLNPLSVLPAYLRVANAANLLWLYAAKCLVPLGLSADYSAWALRPIRTPGDPRLWLGSVAWLAGAAAAIRWRRSRPWPAFGFLLFPLAFVPASNVLFPIGTGFGERLAYFPSVGVALLAGSLAVSAGRAVLHSASAVVRDGALPGVLVLGLLPFTAARNAEWRDDRTIYAAAVRRQPDSARAHYLLGFDAYRRGDLSLAETELEAATRIYRAFPNAWNVLGDVLWRQRKFEEALAAQRVAVGLSPHAADPLYYLALWNAQLGRVDEAKALLHRGAALFPSEKSFRDGLRELEGGR